MLTASHHLLTGWSICSTAAARALIDIEELSAEEVAEKAMKVATNMDVFTNDQYRKEVMDTKEEKSSDDE